MIADTSPSLTISRLQPYGSRISSIPHGVAERVTPPVRRAVLAGSCPSGCLGLSCGGLVRPIVLTVGAAPGEPQLMPCNELWHGTGHGGARHRPAERLRHGQAAAAPADRTHGRTVLGGLQLPQGRQRPRPRRVRQRSGQVPARRTDEQGPAPARGADAQPAVHLDAAGTDGAGRAGNRAPGHAHNEASGRPARIRHLQRQTRRVRPHGVHPVTAVRPGPGAQRAWCWGRCAGEQDRLAYYRNVRAATVRFGGAVNDQDEVAQAAVLARQSHTPGRMRPAGGPGGSPKKSVPKTLDMLGVVA